MQLQEYAPYTRNAQEILQFHEQKTLSKMFKILLFLYQDQYFWFLFTVLGLAHQVDQPKSVFKSYLLTLKFLTPHK